jgi:hypothetical protein
MLTRTMNNRWHAQARSLWAGCLLFVVPYSLCAQNLVPNHSFEEYDTCRVVNDVYYPDTGPLGWFSAGWTPDHFMSCLTTGSFNGAPLSIWAFQYPQDGSCYAGVITYHQTVMGREFFMVELTETLVAGQTYYASFYANAAWEGWEIHPQMWVATSHLGMLFTTQPRQWEINDPVPAPGNFAHVFHPWVITDTVAWTLVSGSFVADSAYRYVMIGNHFDDAVTDTLHLGYSIQYAKAMALIDNVCVSSSLSGCPLALGVADRELERIVLYPNPVIGELMLSGVPRGAEATIYDALGRTMWRGSTTAGTWRFDVGYWAKGSYVLRLEQGVGSRSFRFVLIE